MERAFYEAVGRIQGRVVREGGERRGADEETEISREEIREAIGNLRVEKAAGRDEVPGEV